MRECGCASGFWGWWGAEGEMGVAQSYTQGSLKEENQPFPAPIKACPFASLGSSLVIWMMGGEEDPH